MKKVSLGILLGLTLFFYNCAKDVHTAQECEAAIDKAVATMKAEFSKQELTDEQKSQLGQIDMMMAGMKPKVVKKCRKGKVNIKCLEAAKDLTGLAACAQ
ncbi:MAG: TIGR04454 family lipoprotein [Spirochaetota bacterium]